MIMAQLRRVRLQAAELDDVHVNLQKFLTDLIFMNSCLAQLVHDIVRSNSPRGASEEPVDLEKADLARLAARLPAEH